MAPGIVGKEPPFLLRSPLPPVQVKHVSPVFFSAAFTDLSLSVCTAGLAFARWTSSVGRGRACESSLAAAFARTACRLAHECVV